MKTLTLNIGLNTNDGGKVAIHEACFSITNYFTVTKSRVDTSASGEQTLVAIVEAWHSKLLFNKTLFEICADLKQDCIAIHDGSTEELIGPNADKWQPFNPAYFVPFEAPTKDLVFNDFTRESFVDYLQSTLIPDLEESGSEGHVSDYQTAIFFIQNK